MRTALISILLMAVTGTAYAQFAEDQVRAQLAAQGFENIQFSDQGAQIQVTAERDKIRLESVYDRETGNVVSDRVSQIDEGEDSKSGDSDKITNTAEGQTAAGAGQ
ncbi:hypothetical protein [Paracoccus aerodenitrificans]|uniref:hypothetical protein n=1 Tax=Paracoccus aerodenitrificans TaxID=3017781 RepID=UPI0022F0336A|nr:hypothetical protein [Paracoccus aerodenitrificans]WBU63319.1 hypothetical protein PAE61_13250 [Paracoccus aerodenitrificans]